MLEGVVGGAEGHLLDEDPAGHDLAHGLLRQERRGRRGRGGLDPGAAAPGHAHRQGQDAQPAHPTPNHPNRTRNHFGTSPASTAISGESLGSGGWVIG